jgi:hypothetical protein
MYFWVTKYGAPEMVIQATILRDTCKSEITLPVYSTRGMHPYTAAASEFMGPTCKQLPDVLVCVLEDTT